MPAFLITILSNPVVQKLIFSAIQKIWGYLTFEIRESIANRHYNGEIRKILEQYDELSKLAKERSMDGSLSEQDKDELRKKKIELEERLVNTNK